MDSALVMAWAGVVILLICLGTMLLVPGWRVPWYVFGGVLMGSAVGLQLLLFGMAQVSR